VERLFFRGFSSSALELLFLPMNHPWALYQGTTLVVPLSTNNDLGFSP
jgi:hypothetical protein